MHNFKDYVLRGDEEHVGKMNENITALNEALWKYSALGDLSEAESQALATIKSIVDQCQSGLGEAQKLWNEGRSSSTISRRVFIDDPRYECADR